MDFEKGEVLLFDKPFGWTSFDLVKKIRNLVKVKKTGHAGTLDPLATGLVIICTGKMTKQIDSFQAMEKEYTGTFRLGVTTPCYDMEQPPDNFYPTEHITGDALFAAAGKFTGVIQQLPPAHSAIKVDGKRSYKVARKGGSIDLKAREVTISSFDILSIEMPLVNFRVVCSKGTYIRSLSHDFGKELASGACLAALRRTRIGVFRVEDALTPGEFATKLQLAE